MICQELMRMVILMKMIPEEARHAQRVMLNKERTEDYKTGTYKRAGGVVDPLPEDAPFYVKDYYDYYKTPPWLS